jgi:uncharacterized protein (DUF1499 family)
MKTLPTVDVVRAQYAAGNGSNVAVAEWTTALPPHEALNALEAAARTLPRWEAQDAAAPLLWLTRRTRLFRFVDDIVVLADSSANGTTLRLRSASRIGESDLGQNARNLAELRRAFEAQP